MKMEKGLFIRDIQPGMVVTGLFCVASKSMRQTRNGIPFISMTLTDNSGNMEARIWDRAMEFDGLFSKGDIIVLHAEAVEFNGQCQLKVNDLKPLGQDQDDIDPAMFLPVAPVDRDACWKECEKAMRGVKRPEFRKILREIFSNPETRRMFCQAPAAKKMHHAYIGGLLEHSLNLVRLSSEICRLYSHLDRDLLVTASLCHDIGKIREFSWARPPIDYTDAGRLLGHIVMGLRMVETAMQVAGLNYDSRDLMALRHIILSHHGQREFGSPVLPMTEEAVVFHMLDDLDAKLNFLSGLKAEGREPGWTEFQRLFERYFFLRPRTPAGLAQEEEHSGSQVQTKDNGGEGPESGHPVQSKLF